VTGVSWAFLGFRCFSHFGGLRALGRSDEDRPENVEGRQSRWGLKPVSDPLFTGRLKKCAPRLMEERKAPSPHCLPDPGRLPSTTEHGTARTTKLQRERNQTLRPKVRITALIEIHSKGFDPRSPLHPRSRVRRRVPTVARSAKVGCLRGLRELRVASQPSLMNAAERCPP